MGVVNNTFDQSEISPRIVLLAADMRLKKQKKTRFETNFSCYKIIIIISFYRLFLLLNFIFSNNQVSFSMSETTGVTVIGDIGNAPSRKYFKCIN